MKTFRRLISNGKSAGYLLAGVIVCALLMAAGVNGLFNHVTSTTGYQVNGAAGSSGQALCSDGTNYVNPCSVAGTGITALTGPVTASGSGSVATTITATGVTAGSYTFASFTVNAAGQLTAASSAGTFVARTCNVNGCYEILNGTVHEWGVTGDFDTGPTSITLPFTMPAALETVSLTQCEDDSGTGCSGSSVVTREWEAGSFSTTGFLVRNDGLGEAMWNAWGH